MLILICGWQHPFLYQTLSQRLLEKLTPNILTENYLHPYTDIPPRPKDIASTKQQENESAEII